MVGQNKKEMFPLGSMLWCTLNIVTAKVSFTSLPMLIKLQLVTDMPGHNTASVQTCTVHPSALCSADKRWVNCCTDSFL